MIKKLVHNVAAFVLKFSLPRLIASDTNRCLFRCFFVTKFITLLDYVDYTESSCEMFGHFILIGGCCSLIRFGFLG